MPLEGHYVFVTVEEGVEHALQWIFKVEEFFHNSAVDFQPFHYVGASLFPVGQRSVERSLLTEPDPLEGFEVHFRQDHFHQHRVQTQVSRAIAEDEGLVVRDHRFVEPGGEIELIDVIQATTETDLTTNVLAGSKQVFVTDVRGDGDVVHGTVDAPF
ncbi:hypothetical protein D3C73_704130 [compost metagenome]